MRKATIKKVTKGKNKGQFRYKLTADNGEPLSENETYHNEKDLLATLKKYFPDFPVAKGYK